VLFEEEVSVRKSRAKGWNWWTVPAFVLTVIICLIPWLIMIYNSFFDLSYSKVGSGNYVGLENYRKAFSDPNFFEAIKNTLQFVIVSLPIEFLLGLFFAIIVARHLRMRKFVVPIIIIPMVIAPTVVGLLWQLNLNPSFGPIGIYLRSRGMALEGLTGSVKTALSTMIAIDIWQWTPFLFLLFIAGLLGVPKEPLEAAEVDGASGIQTFRKVILPSLRPIFIVAFLLRFTDAYKIFDTIWTMTGGGPGLATETVSIFGYRITFKFWHIGYGSAVVTLIYIISYLASYLFMKVTVKPEKKID
jgi:multiple sugar transport system permease protein